MLHRVEGLTSIGLDTTMHTRVARHWSNRTWTAYSPPPPGARLFTRLYFSTTPHRPCHRPERPNAQRRMVVSDLSASRLWPRLDEEDGMSSGVPPRWFGGGLPRPRRCAVTYRVIPARAFPLIQCHPPRPPKNRRRCRDIRDKFVICSSSLPIPETGSA
jgi:hypothetical protein